MTLRVHPRKMEHFHSTRKVEHGTYMYTPPGRTCGHSVFRLLICWGMECPPSSMMISKPLGVAALNSFRKVIFCDQSPSAHATRKIRKWHQPTCCGSMTRMRTAMF